MAKMRSSLDIVASKAIYTKGPAKKKSKKAADAEAAAAAKVVAVEAEWKSLLDQALSKKARRAKYNPKETFVVGDVIDHPNFGEGVVTKLIHPNKAEIIFKHDLKLMMHSLSR
jgi:hypothetical protein